MPLLQICRNLLYHNYIGCEDVYPCRVSYRGVGDTEVGDTEVGVPPTEFLCHNYHTATIGYGTQHEDIAASMANLVTVNIWF